MFFFLIYFLKLYISFFLASMHQLYLHGFPVSTGKGEKRANSIFCLLIKHTIFFISYRNHPDCPNWFHQFLFLCEERDTQAAHYLWALKSNATHPAECLQQPRARFVGSAALLPRLVAHIQSLYRCNVLNVYLHTKTLFFSSFHNCFSPFVGSYSSSTKMDSSVPKPR